MKKKITELLTERLKKISLKVISAAIYGSWARGLQEATYLLIEDSLKKDIHFLRFKKAWRGISLTTTSTIH